MILAGVDNSGSVKGLRYAEFVVPLVQAVQELDSANVGRQEIIRRTG